jgi:hypothetical protein
VLFLLFEFGAVTNPYLFGMADEKWIAVVIEADLFFEFSR